MENLDGGQRMNEHRVDSGFQWCGQSRKIAAMIITFDRLMSTVSILKNKIKNHLSKYAIHFTSSSHGPDVPVAISPENLPEIHDSISG